MDNEEFVHPGAILKKELKERNIPKSAFAMRIGMYPSHFSDVLSGKRNINAKLAIKIEKELDIAAEYWLGLQVDFDLYQERNKQEGK